MKKNYMRLINMIAGGIIGAGILSCFKSKQHKKDIASAKKYETMVRVYDEWMSKQLKGRTIRDYLVENQYYRIAIYGMGYIGKRLYSELENSEINVAYIIDREPEKVSVNVKKCGLDDELENVSAVIITAMTDHLEIEAYIEAALDCRILFIEDILLAL